MSIYHKEDARQFDRAMQSVWSDQCIKPNEIVLVEDGLLTSELDQGIDKWKKELGGIFKVISLRENIGLGGALNIGLKQCSFDLIARMDTDDISLPNRFKKQLEVFKSMDVDVCGTWMSEFNDDESKTVSCRRVPEKHKDIVRFAKSRTPVNHITAMYKKAAVLNVGGYIKTRTIEDYNLWVKMILNGSKFYNIQESLANARIGNGQIEDRRGGLNNAMLEVKAQKDFYKMSFLSLYEFLRNIVIGSIIRLLPKKIMKIVFKIIRKL